ncbi:uncharacterized protein LOC129598154 [Paramacrobiotus metropolitanus]|uniref:uncharacterized protein LOC129598154 n=1 Tax=Paramacrobiotus metropolitanus TaxID=2943436 RepID=UPI0024463FE2|nr:uncharacterized protein LOC129598154 [Paramacrobiotus metropolitanus]
MRIQRWPSFLQPAPSTIVLMVHMLWSGLRSAANPYYPSFYDASAGDTPDTLPTRYRLTPPASGIPDVSSLIYQQTPGFDDPVQASDRQLVQDDTQSPAGRAYGGPGPYNSLEGNGGYAYGNGYGTGPGLPLNSGNAAVGGRFPLGSGPVPPAFGPVGALGPNPYLPQLGRIMGGFGKFARPAFFPGYPFLNPYIGLDFVGRTDRYRGNYMIYNGDYDGYVPPTTPTPTTTTPT